jgi:hypothetical protein
LGGGKIHLQLDCSAFGMKNSVINSALLGSVEKLTCHLTAGKHLKK